MSEHPSRAERVAAAKQAKLRGVLQQQREVLEGIFALLPQRRSQLAAQPTAELARINNVLEFSMLYAFDFNVLLDDTLEHGGSRRGNLYARLLVLFVYEAALTLRTLLAGQFQSDLRVVGYSDGDVSSVRGVHSGFEQAFARCNREFKDVRMNVSAHRDPSATKQLKLIEELDVEAVIDMAYEMETFTVQLNAVLAAHLRNLLG